MTLAEFLLARITEDEAEARSDAEGVCSCCGHAAERTLAEAAVKRAVVEGFLTLEREPRRWTDPLLHYQYKHGLQWVIRPFAAVYAGHPDYREDWTL